MSLIARLPLFLKCLICCSDKDVLLGSSQVSSPQHKPYNLELHPGQQSANGNSLSSLPHLQFCCCLYFSTQSLIFLCKNLLEHPNFINGFNRALLMFGNHSLDVDYCIFTILFVTDFFFLTYPLFTTIFGFLDVKLGGWYSYIMISKIVLFWLIYTVFHFLHSHP